jgi:hypothetical protein
LRYTRSTRNHRPRVTNFRIQVREHHQGDFNVEKKLVRVNTSTSGNPEMLTLKYLLGCRLRPVCNALFLYSELFRVESISEKQRKGTEIMLISM